MIITIYFDSKKKAKQIIKPTSAFKLKNVRTMVETVTRGNYYSFKIDQ